MALCRCRSTSGTSSSKELIQISERDTSKLCSGCGHKQDMRLYMRTYRCLTCGLVMDRDANSAVNIREWFAFPAPVHTRVIPCGVRLYAPQLKNVCSL
jgi:putative transposase